MRSATLVAETAGSTMNIGDGVIGALVGAVFGAGGLGGLWAMLGRREDNTTKLLVQYYSDLSARQTASEAVQANLQGRVDDQQDTINKQEIKLERQQTTIDQQQLTINQHQLTINTLHAENVCLRHENKELKYRVDGLDGQSEASDG
jgi:uncharacterized protein HemX